MKSKIRVLGLVALIPLAISGCQLTEEEKEKLNDAQVDLEQLADQIIITYPANNSIVSDSIVTVRADIPEAAEAQEVTLFVDGVEVAKDTDGAPWEISWPSYYWADGGAHTLLLKTITGGGNEVRNNQQFQVNVGISANNLLKFEAGTDGVVLKDENSFLVEFDEFPRATIYEVQYSNDNAVNLVETPSLEVELTNLEVGEYELSYRAIMEHSGLTTLEGPWSNPVTIEVSPPDLPSLNSSELSASDEGYDLLVSWEDLGEGNTYKVLLENVTDSGASTTYDEISNSELLITGLNIGEYRWSLIRTNPLGHESLPSNAESIEVGIFTKHFGGTRDDRSKQIVHSRDGGYIVLGYTKSYEISETVDSQGDDWIFKINSQGNIVWQHVFNASGRDRFNDIIELEDGSIVVVGQDWGSNEAVALKLDGNGASLWEVTYRPDSISERYDFLDIVEFNNSLYVASAEWGAGSCNGCTRRTNYYLHTISLSDGTVSDPLDIPSIAGITINSVSELVQTSSGNLLISGYAMPEGSNSDDYWAGGAYLQVLSTDLDQITVWNNVGSYMHGNAGDVIELSNGNFAVIGQGQDGGEPNISVIYSNGSEFRNYVGEYGKEHYGSQSIVAGSNGEIYGLFIDQDVYSYPYPLTFLKLNSNATLESQSYLLGYKDYVSSSGLVRNDDDTFTLLFSEGQSGYSNYDIVVVKSLMN